MKRPTALQVKIVWDATIKPSARQVADAMTAQGYLINYRTVTRYKASNWSDPTAKKTERALVVAKKAVAKKDGPADPGEVSVIIGRRLARMEELYARSVAENQATLQQTGLIASIIVAEEMVAMIEQLTLEAPGDVARLLHAITEASQVKHVGGAGQVPDSGDPRVIEHEPAAKNPVSEALSRFRKNAGLA
jgi:hypothetical protein